MVFIEFSGLELRYLSFCSNLKNVSMSGCPLASLPDYRRIVLKGQFKRTLLFKQSFHQFYTKGKYFIFFDNKSHTKIHM